MLSYVELDIDSGSRLVKPRLKQPMASLKAKGVVAWGWGTYVTHVRDLLLDLGRGTKQQSPVPRNHSISDLVCASLLVFDINVTRSDFLVPTPT